MKWVPTQAAYELLHEGQIALSEVEHNGCRIDRDYVEKANASALERIRDYETRMRADPFYATWRRRFGEKTNVGSPEQLAEVVFKVMGYKAPKVTGVKGRASAAESALETVNEPFVKTLYLPCQKLRKACSTYLGGIIREMVRHDDGYYYVHPVYNLNTVETFRSSCVAKGTLVEVVRDVSKHPKGIPIEEVKAGDYVYCYDDDLRLRIRRVKWAGHTGRKRVVRLHWATKGKKGHLDVTPEHRIRLSDGRYVRADSLLGRPTTRGEGQSKHAPRCQAMALGRTEDRLWVTGEVDPVLDHRLVYSEVVGELGKTEVVHHKDENHLNNNPQNLQKMAGPSEHSKHHAPTSLTDDVRRKGVRKRQENHALYGDRWKAGSENVNWIGLTKFQTLRMLAACGGSPTEVRNRGWMDFDTFKRKMKLWGIDQGKVRRRYDADGRYITRGDMSRASGGGVGPAARRLRVGYYTAKSLYEERGIDPGSGPGRPGRVNNHAIVRVEELEGEVDVYDLSVEDCHNFIANEICVHNCSDPNYQNQPNRNPEIGEMIRRSYVPRPGNQLIELDYGQIEVRIPCCYNFDPTLIEYVCDPTKDMHRDVAAQVFFLDPKQVSKETRSHVKNKVVFPLFYGSYYAQVAPPIWEAMDRFNLCVEGAKKADGTPVTLREHMASKGITELGACDPDGDPRPGTFEKHLKDIEEDFWGKRFVVYSEWKRRWIEDYYRLGGCRFLTGFVMKGPHKRNDITNYCIQGPAFHCLLWSLIKINKKLKRYRMKTKIIGEVHDSINADGPPRERDDFIHMSMEVMTREIRTWAPWLNIPLVVEAEVCPVDAPWSEKMALVEKDGRFVPGNMDKWKSRYGPWEKQVVA